MGKETNQSQTTSLYLFGLIELWNGVSGVWKIVEIDKLQFITAKIAEP